jgi:class 3 adenylate cyclase
MSRDVVVVLLVDTVESTALLTSIGQDRMSMLADVEMTALSDAVASNGGRVVRTLGDGLMAIFPSAVAALDAAAEMHRSVGQLNDGARFGAPVRVRVTIGASDAVVVGDEIRGVAPIHAARLEELAGAGETVCTETVRLLTLGWDRYEFEAMGPRPLRGLTEPVVLHRVRVPVADLIGMPETLEAIRRFEFVGRRNELWQLNAAWSAARSNRGGVVVVRGEPGVGKSRLCRELAVTVRNEGAVVLHGRCSEQATQPYQPFVQSLRYSLARVADAMDMLGPGAPELSRIVPELSGMVPGLDAPSDVDPDTARYRLFEAVADWLVALSYRSPVLFVLDDVGWADEGSIQLLRHAGPRLAHERVLIVAPCRSAEVAEHVRQWLQAERSTVGRLDLGGLGDEEAVEFAARLLDGPLDESARAAVAAVARRVGGNPLYLGEMVTDLSERAELERTRDAKWTATGRPDQVVIPPTIGDVIRGRIERLPDLTRHVLALASVVGPAFPVDVVLELLPEPAVALAQALDVAVDAAIIHPSAETSYEFMHVVYRDVVYSGLSSLRRAAEHERVAEAIIRLHEDELDPWLELLALHFEQALDGRENRRRAVEYLRRAGHQAEDKVANDQAVGLFRRALDVMERVHPPGDEGMFCDVMIELGTAERRAGHHAARRTLLRAAECALAMPDSRRAARAVFGAGRGIFSIAGSVDAERVDVLRRTLEAVGPDAGGVRARLLATLGAELTFDDDPTAAEAASDEAMTLARELGDPTTLVIALGLRMVALWRADRVDERLRLGAELDAIRDIAGPQHSGRFLPAMTSYCQAAMEAGDLATADRLLPLIETTARDLRQPTSVGYAKLRLATRACIAGQLDEAEQLAEEALSLCSQAGQPDADAFYAGHVFTIRLHQGRLADITSIVDDCAKRYPGIRPFAAASAVCAAEGQDEARCRSRFDEAVAGFDGIRFDLNWLCAMAMLAHAAAFLSDVPYAQRLRAALNPYRSQYVDNASTFFGSVEHYYALMCSVVGDDEAADAAFGAALQAHDRLRSPPLVARTQLEYAQSLSRRSVVPVDRMLDFARAAANTADQRGYLTISRQAHELLGRFAVTRR